MRHLLSTKDASRQEAIAILDVAEGMSEVEDRDIKKLPTCAARPQSTCSSKTRPGRGSHLRLPQGA